MRKFILSLVMLTMCGCSSVNVRTDEHHEETRPPTYQKSYNYWWWGLRGRHSINVREVCQGRPVIQVQAVDTVSNIFAGLFTLGIYAPRTARIWCGEV